jgi:NOL1/NOP2/fmu family ribosome biogenesis protein
MALLQAPGGDAGGNAGGSGSAERSGSAGRSGRAGTAGPSGGLDLFWDFAQEFLALSLDPARLTRRGDALYLAPPGLPALAGLRILRAGWYLGEFKEKRFEPSQALAMGLTAGQARLRLELPRHSPLPQRYLKGETLDLNTAEGWHLVCVEGFPLGWAKAAGGRCKNKYHRGWLMQ